MALDTYHEIVANMLNTNLIGYKVIIYNLNQVISIVWKN